MDAGVAREGLRRHRRQQDRPDPQLSTDRRQLIEEAAGVTKYRAAARGGLKLEAAQQRPDPRRRHHLRGREAARRLKRQARKPGARRLREELRRWEKVQFAQRYRAMLGQAIEPPGRSR